MLFFAFFLAISIDRSITLLGAVPVDGLGKQSVRLRDRQRTNGMLLIRVRMRCIALDIGHGQYIAVVGTPDHGDRGDDHEVTLWSLWASSSCIAIFGIFCQLAAQRLKMLSKSETGEQNVTKEAQQANPASKTDQTKQSQARNPLATGDGQRATGDFPGLELARQLAFLMASPSRWADRTGSGCCTYEHVPRSAVVGWRFAW